MEAAPRLNLDASAEESLPSPTGSAVTYSGEALCRLMRREVRKIEQHQTTQSHKYCPFFETCKFLSNFCVSLFRTEPTLFLRSSDDSNALLCVLRLIDLAVTSGCLLVLGDADDQIKVEKQEGQGRQGLMGRPPLCKGGLRPCEDSSILW